MLLSASTLALFSKKYFGTVTFGTLCTKYSCPVSFVTLRRKYFISINFIDLLCKKYFGSDTFRDFSEEVLRVSSVWGFFSGCISVQFRLDFFLARRTLTDVGSGTFCRKYFEPGTLKTAESTLDQFHSVF